MTTTTRQPVALAYERISRFRVAQEGLDTDVARGVVRQHADNEAAAQRLGLGHVVHITEDNTSASRFKSKEREGFSELLHLVRAGGVTHVLVWLLDRIVRDGDDLSALLAACRQGGAVIVQTGTGSTIDPNNPESVLHAKISGAVAEYEVAKMSIRQRRHKAEAASVGKPHGGRRRFGYEPGMVEVRPSEARVIEALADRLLGGESLASCARWLAEHDVATADGGKWTGPNLRTMMGRPHLAGWRVHQGAVVGRGDWPAVLTDEVHQGLVQLFARPERRTSPSNARVHLLAGLAVCDKCGAVLRGRPVGTVAKREARGDNPRAYACSTGGHCHRPTEAVDTVVEAAVIERLSRMDARGVYKADHEADALGGLETRAEALRAQVEGYDDALTDGTMPQARYDRLVAKAEAALAVAEAELAAERARVSRPKAVLRGMVGADAHAAWEAASLGQRRALIELLTERIALVGADGGRRAFDPERHVLIDWRASE